MNRSNFKEGDTMYSLIMWIYLLYEGVSKSFQTELIMKYTLTTINIWEATQGYGGITH